MDFFFEDEFRLNLRTAGPPQRILLFQKLIDFSFPKQFLVEATFWKSSSW